MVVCSGSCGNLCWVCVCVCVYPYHGYFPVITGGQSAASIAFELRSLPLWWLFGVPAVGGCSTSRVQLVGPSEGAEGSFGQFLGSMTME